METIHKIGRRKTAVARVYLSEGKGEVTINDRKLDNYFTTETLKYKVLQPLTLTENLSSYDIKAKVFGGGITGQAEAIRLVNEAAERYFVGNAQTLKQLEAMENSLRENAKIVLTEHGISPTLLLGSLPVSVSSA